MRFSACGITMFLLFSLSSRSVSAQKWVVPLQDPKNNNPNQSYHRAESMVLTPDGRLVVTAGFFRDGLMRKAYGEVRLFEIQTGKLVATLTAKSEGHYAFRPGVLAVSPNGKLIAAARFHFNGARAINIVDVWDLKTKKIRYQLPVPGAGRICIAFSPDSQTLTLGSWRRPIAIWSMKTGKPIVRFPKSSIGAWTVAYSPDGKILAACASGIVFSSPQTGRELGTIPASPEFNNEITLAFSPDGKRIAAGGTITDEGRTKRQVTRVWKLNVAGNRQRSVQAKLVATFDGHPKDDVIYSVVFSPDGKYLVSAAQDKTARIFNVHTQSQAAVVRGHTDFVFEAKFSRDGKHLVTLGRDSLRMWAFEKLLPQKRKAKNRK